MSISGLVVHAHPEKIDAVRQGLLAHSGVEIHATGADGRLVVTVDQQDDRKSADTLVAIQQQAGVLSASLVYNHFEHSPEDSPCEQEQSL